MSNFRNVDIPFKFTVPVQQNYKEDGRQYLSGLASTTNTSATGHRMLMSAIQRMKEMAVGLPGFLNHNPDKVYGQIVSVEESSDNEFNPVFQLFKLTGKPLVDEALEKILHWLDEGLKLGMSIGGRITKARFIEEDDDYIIEIKDLELYEVSVTPIPAVTETRGKTKMVDSCNDPISCQIAQFIKHDVNFDDFIVKNDVELENVNQEVDKMPENKIVESIKLDEKYVTKDDFKPLEESLRAILDERKAEKEAKEKAELKQAKEDERKELLTEVGKVAGQIVEEKLGEALKEMRTSREHVRESDKTKIDDVVKEDETVPEKILGQSFTDPLKAPAHIGGIVQKAYTPDELINKLGA
jgi:HK97 family phage prohead protease